MRCFAASDEGRHAASTWRWTRQSNNAQIFDCDQTCLFTDTCCQVLRKAPLRYLRPESAAVLVWSMPFVFLGTMIVWFSLRFRWRTFPTLGVSDISLREHLPSLFCSSRPWDWFHLDVRSTPGVSDKWIIDADTLEHYSTDNGQSMLVTNKPGPDMDNSNRKCSAQQNPVSTQTRCTTNTTRPLYGDMDGRQGTWIYMFRGIGVNVLPRHPVTHYNNWLLARTTLRHAQSMSSGLRCCNTTCIQEFAKELHGYLVNAFTKSPRALTHFWIPAQQLLWSSMRFCVHDLWLTNFIRTQIKSTWH